MFRLTGGIKPYAWGSRTAIAELRGVSSPSASPEAELWLGAHPLASCEVDVPGGPRLLAEWIRERPVEMLGRAVAEGFANRLPFLMKVLAADEPLSLQAHPSSAQAREGFAREEALGLALTDPRRTYKDESHKPELICALSRFEVLSGFRSPADATRLLDALGVDLLRPYVAQLAAPGGAASLRRVFERLVTPAPAEHEPLVRAVGASARRLAREPGADARAYAWAAELAERYPSDGGVVCSLLLRYVELAPGGAMFLPAGNLHAYLRGLGVEIMASSDNVLRGGLTPKHVDPAELVRVLDFDAEAPPVLSPRATERGELVYETPAPEFRLSRVEVSGGSFAAEVRGPEILLCVRGAVTARAAGGASTTLTRGAAAFVPASAGSWVVSGSGEIFRARVGEGY